MAPAPLCNAYGVNPLLGTVTQGALRDPGLWSRTPAAYVGLSKYEKEVDKALYKILARSANRY